MNVTRRTLTSCQLSVIEKDWVYYCRPCCRRTCVRCRATPPPCACRAAVRCVCGSRDLAATRKPASCDVPCVKRPAPEPGSSPPFWGWSRVDLALRIEAIGASCISQGCDCAAIVSRKHSAGILVNTSAMMHELIFPCTGMAYPTVQCGADGLAAVRALLADCGIQAQPAIRSRSERCKCAFDPCRLRRAVLLL